MSDRPQPSAADAVADVSVVDATVSHPTEEQHGPSPAPVSPSEKTGKGKGIRALRDRIALRRSYSPKHSSPSSPTLVSPAPVADIHGTQDTATPDPLQRSKSNVFERLIHTKLSPKRGGRKAKDGVVAADTAPIPVSLDPAPSNSSASSQPAAQDALPAISESEPAADGVEPVAEFAVPNPDPEPFSLAQKVHSLLSALPPFLSTVEPAQGSDGKKTTKGGDDGVGATPGEPSALPDSRVISLLMSPSFMNGSISRGRQSVWTMLDNIRLKSLTSNSGASAGATSDGTTPVDSTMFEDSDSVMFYAPLLPDENSSVELARSEIVSVDENGAVIEVLVDDAPLPQWDSSAVHPKSLSSIEAEKFKWHWPWHREPPTPSKPKTIEKRVWVPSNTKLSLQVMWWGYRLWLPPPILAKLSDKEIEAVKLASVVTTALTWFMNNVPDSILPPPLRPALMLVKSLVPYIGYIGGFIAWSWGAIKGFDVGNGVKLTATWLLPIALVPGTWNDEDVPKLPPPSDPPIDPSSPAPPSAPPSAPPASDPPPSGLPVSAPPASPAPPPPSSSTPAPSDPSSPPISTTEPLQPAHPAII